MDNLKEVISYIDYLLPMRKREVYEIIHGLFCNKEIALIGKDLKNLEKTKNILEDYFGEEELSLIKIFDLNKVSIDEIEKHYLKVIFDKIGDSHLKSLFFQKSKEFNNTSELRIKYEDMISPKLAIKNIGYSDDASNLIYHVFKALLDKGYEFSDSSLEEFSDAVKISAYLNNRETVDISDLTVLKAWLFITQETYDIVCKVLKEGIDEERARSNILYIGDFIGISQFSSSCGNGYGIGLI